MTNPSKKGSFHGGHPVVSQEFGVLMVLGGFSWDFHFQLVARRLSRFLLGASCHWDFYFHLLTNPGTLNPK